MTGQTAAGRRCSLVQDIVKKEGAPAPFKEAIPPCVVAPLGAMNFAAKELPSAMQSAEAEERPKLSLEPLLNAASKPPRCQAITRSRCPGCRRTALRRVQTQLWRTSRQQVVQSLQKSRLSDTPPRGCRTDASAPLPTTPVVSPLHRPRWRRTPNLQGQPMSDSRR